MLIVTDVNDEKKMVAIWLTNAEKNDPELRGGLKDLCAEYHAKKYMVAVFLSGTDSLYDNTLELLKYNRQRSAHKDILQEKGGRLSGNIKA